MSSIKRKISRAKIRNIKIADKKASVANVQAAVKEALIKK